MSQRNSFFASTFARELDRWKKTNRKSQEDFAEAIGKGPNMITRYKRGTDFPSDETLTRICRVLQVDREIFYPRTFDDKLKYDSAFQEKVRKTLEEMELEELTANRINLLFWEFLWQTMPNLKGLLPSSLKGKQNGFLFQKEMNGGIEFFDQEDLDVVSALQKEVVLCIHEKLIRYALGQHLDSAQPMADGESRGRQLDAIYDRITLELLRKRDEETGPD